MDCSSVFFSKKKFSLSIVTNIETCLLELKLVLKKKNSLIHSEARIYYIKSFVV